MDFVDCLVMSVRHSSTKPDTILDFDAVLNLYFGDCDDISPLVGDETTCAMLVKEGGNLCSADPQKYCLVSCFKCAHSGQMLWFDSSDKEWTEISSLRMQSRSEITALTGDHNQRMTDRKLGHKTAQMDRDEHLHKNENNKGRIAPGHICPIKAKMKHINRNRLVFMADVHIEPWYNPDSTEYIARFDGYNSDNMFECRDKNGKLLNTNTHTHTGHYTEGADLISKSLFCMSDFFPFYIFKLMLGPNRVKFQYLFYLQGLLVMIPAG